VLGGATPGASTAQLCPNLGQATRAGRAFLVRAERFLADPVRIRQFLDIGLDLPAGRLIACY
jgi:S-adenosyl methyltransferase